MGNLSDYLKSFLKSSLCLGWVRFSAEFFTSIFRILLRCGKFVFVTSISKFSSNITIIKSQMYLVDQKNPPINDFVPKEKNLREKEHISCFFFAFCRPRRPNESIAKKIPGVSLHIRLLSDKRFTKKNTIRRQFRK